MNDIPHASWYYQLCIYIVLVPGAVEYRRPGKGRVRIPCPSGYSPAHSVHPWLTTRSDGVAQLGAGIAGSGLKNRINHWARDALGCRYAAQTRSHRETHVHEQTRVLPAIHQTRTAMERSRKSHGSAHQNPNPSPIRPWSRPLRIRLRNCGGGVWGGWVGVWS